MRWILYACRAPSWNWLDFQNKKKSSCNLFRCIDIINFVAWGRSSAGRALDWQSRGQGFDPPRLHPRIFKNQKFASGSFYIRAISRSNCLCDFSKKFLHGSIYSRILMNAPLGGVAQLGERLTGSQEVRGSIPLVSTQECSRAGSTLPALFYCDRSMFDLIFLCGGFDLNAAILRSSFM